MKESVRYHLYLNGKFYGSGPIGYMQELIRDYLMMMATYGKASADFKVVEAGQKGDE